VSTPRPARALAAALAACGLLVSCSGGTTDDRPDGPDPPGPAAPADRHPRGSTGTPHGADSEPALPATPPAGPAALADQLERALSVLRDDGAAPSETRAAGRLHQLAVRHLSGRPAAYERAVTSRLPQGTAALVRPAVAAGRELRALTEPQPALPDWRILPPPPPEELMRHYRAAQRRTGVPWHHLAAIHLVETRMGRIRGTSVAGARGPMQFLPSTWDLYGAGGDIADPADAVMAAARLLRANGAPEDLRGALWHYNPSDHYVRAVSAHAAVLRRAPWTYRGYWHWQVVYEHRSGPHLLPVGYPRRPARAIGSPG
jgi:hypothetical protein